MAGDPALLQEFGLPLLARLQKLAEQGRRPAIGLNAPVGAGKSSLCRLLAGLAPERGLRLAVASIDDFYLPWPERLRALAGNPFGVTRVPPGSHDPDLLRRCLAHWRGGGELRLPRFDKTLRNGEGDRCGEQLLQADALLLEGWLVGCRALGPALDGLDLDALMAGAGPRTLTPEERAWLPRWDRELQAYGPAWAHLDALWVLRPLRWTLPWRWRFQAEARQRRSGGAALSAEALDRLVRASLCSLPPELYAPELDAPGLRAPEADAPGQERCSGVPVAAIGVLDGRRRLRGLKSSAGDHSSASSSLSIG
jgi:D-glycerate 3-kinase